MTACPHMPDCDEARNDPEVVSRRVPWAPRSGLAGCPPNASVAPPAPYLERTRDSGFVLPTAWFAAEDDPAGSVHGQYQPGSSFWISSIRMGWGT